MPLRLTCAPVPGSWPNSATEVTSSGVYPTNQTALCSSVVPVLPAAGRPRALARQPVPPWSATTPWSIEVTWRAVCSLTAWVVLWAGSATGSPSRSTDCTSHGVICLPPLSSVAYTPAMSSTLGVEVPSGMEPTGSSDGVLLGRPSAIAVSRTLASPVSWASWAKAEFTDQSVACWRVIWP